VWGIFFSGGVTDPETMQRIGTFGFPISKAIGYPDFSSVLTAKSRNPRLALARLPPIASECVKNLHKLYLSYYLHSVKKLDLKSIFVAQPSIITKIGRGSHRLYWPAEQQNVTSLYSYVAETCIYHIY
jgi:hypothetical protein